MSVPRALVDERSQLLKRASVHVKILDVEPLAILNGALHLTDLESGELLVVVNIGRQSSVLCLFSEKGPVVARYLEVGAEIFTEQIRVAFQLSPSRRRASRGRSRPAEAPKAEAACREVVERMAEDIRLSLTFYRTEYDRESLPALRARGLDGHSLHRPLAGRPARALRAVRDHGSLPGRGRSRPQIGDVPRPPGPQFLQAFGLALRRTMSARFALDLLHPGHVAASWQDWFVGPQGARRLLVVGGICAGVILLVVITLVLPPPSACPGTRAPFPSSARTSPRATAISVSSGRTCRPWGVEAKRQVRWADVLNAFRRQTPPTIKLQKVEAGLPPARRRRLLGPGAGHRVPRRAGGAQDRSGNAAQGGAASAARDRVVHGRPAEGPSPSTGATGSRAGS